MSPSHALKTADIGSSWWARLISATASCSLPPSMARSNALQPVRPGIAGVEFQSLLVLSLASGKIPVVLHIVAAQNSMGIGQGRVQLQRLAGGSIGFWIVFAGTATSKASQCAIAIGQTHICQSVAGVFRDGLVEIGNCGGEVRRGLLVPVVTPL